LIFPIDSQGVSLAAGVRVRRETNQFSDHQRNVNIPAIRGRLR
jgi:hypothetical protein